jgi:hypothetical protein
MVKFGKYLEAHRVPEWHTQYVHYKRLKKILRRIKLQYDEERAREQSKSRRTAPPATAAANASTLSAPRNINTNVNVTTNDDARNVSNPNIAQSNRLFIQQHPSMQDNMHALDNRHDENQQRQHDDEDTRQQQQAGASSALTEVVIRPTNVSNDERQRQQQRRQAGEETQSAAAATRSSSAPSSSTPSFTNNRSVTTGLVSFDAIHTPRNAAHVLHTGNQYTVTPEILSLDQEYPSRRHSLQQQHYRNGNGNGNGNGSVNHHNHDRNDNNGNTSSDATQGENISNRSSLTRRKQANVRFPNGDEEHDNNADNVLDGIDKQYDNQKHTLSDGSVDMYSKEQSADADASTHNVQPSKYHAKLGYVPYLPPSFVALIPSTDIIGYEYEKQFFTLLDLDLHKRAGLLANMSYYSIRLQP